MAFSASNALTTPSAWDITLVEGAGLETHEDLYIVLKSTFPQANVEIKKKDEKSYRLKLPYCTKLLTLKGKLAEYDRAVTVVSAVADLSDQQTCRLAELKKRVLSSKE